MRIIKKGSSVRVGSHFITSRGHSYYFIIPIVVHIMKQFQFNQWYTTHHWVKNNCLYPAEPYGFWNNDTYHQDFCIPIEIQNDWVGLVSK